VTDPVARDRHWIAAAAAVAALALVARLHDAFAFPPLHDFDGPAHALSVFALHEGQLPDPRTWAGFHPPLYYALGAALWRVLPDAVPVHAALRLLSAAAGLGAVAIAWRALRRFATPADAAVTAALVASAPVVAIATSMLGNETLCALFATAVLARLVAIPDDPQRVVRHALATGVLAGLAALSKSTGLLAAGVAVLAYAVQARELGRPAIAAALAACGSALALAAPFFVWLAVTTGSPLALISGGKPSDAEGSEMAAQPPGERHLADYFTVPIATIAAPFKDGAGMLRSVPGLLYASTWADGHGEFLPSSNRSVVGAAALGALLGLVPTGLALAGLVRLVRRRERAASAPLAFAALLGVAFLAQTWLVPRYSAVKASYLLSALLPASIALATGIGGRPVWRAALLAIAVYASFLTWWGWWT
jgi:Dolichyl-phosphate-mannose-protein mannosyltransferase